MDERAVRQVRWAVAGLLVALVTGLTLATMTALRHDREEGCPAPPCPRPVDGPSVIGLLYNVAWEGALAVGLAILWVRLAAPPRSSLETAVALSWLVLTFSAVGLLVPLALVGAPAGETMAIFAMGVAFLVYGLWMLTVSRRAVRSVAAATGTLP